MALARRIAQRAIDEPAAGVCAQGPLPEHIAAAAAEAYARKGTSPST